MLRRTFIKVAVAAAAIAGLAGSAQAQGKELKVGVIFDLSGPLAAGGRLGALAGGAGPGGVACAAAGCKVGWKIRPMMATTPILSVPKLTFHKRHW